jgi:hypothetical protein
MECSTGSEDVHVDRTALAAAQGRTGGGDDDGGDDDTTGSMRDPCALVVAMPTPLLALPPGPWLWSRRFDWSRRAWAPRL